jgi:Flp pilus assembly protein TadG
MSPRWRGRTRSERGAIAIMVAVLATALFACAALAVDLGNAWARKRAVQKQVDVSALAAGWMLPMTVTNQSTIAAKVASYLNETNNHVTGQATVTGSQLLNGDTADGEILWQNDDGTACSDNCPQMRVVAPQAQVDFGFANVFGASHVEVQRDATVRVVSELPPAEDTLPFWLPTGCGFGPTEADTTQGGTTSTATASPTATATTSTSSVRFSPDPSVVGTQSLIGASVTEVGYMGATTVSGYSVSGLSGAGVKKITLRAYPPTGTAYVDFAAQTTSGGNLPSFQVSQADLTQIPGDWWIWAIVRSGNTDYYSTNHLVIRVTGGPTASASPTATSTGISVGCVGQDRGNFGQLDSPRAEGGSKQTRFARNIALGIDHMLAPYVFAEGQTERKQCDEPGYVLPGAQLDDMSRDGNNCIIGDTGNDGPKTYDALVTGLGDGTPGRLEVVHGHTTCHDRSDKSISGHLINNDVLSCFLRNGATLGSISATSGVNTSMLDPKVMDSPRFVWLPVVYAYDRAQKSFQPIRTFVPGFITDETQTSEATDANGLELDGNSVKVLHVFTFNRDALPPLEKSRTTDYNASMGGAIVRLVG